MASALIRRLAVLVAGLAVAATVPMAPAAAEGTGTVQGRITDERGAPSSSQITLSPVDPASDSIYSYSGDDGLFTIADVPAGQYRFSINDNVHPPQWAYGAESFDAAALIDVVEGQVTTVNEQYLPLTELVVTVTDAATGQPVAGACATVTTPTSPHACAGAGGVVTVADVWPGTWSVAVSDRDGAHWTSTVDGVGFEQGVTTRISVALDPAASITATVRDATTGQPVFACVRTADPEGHGILAGGGCFNYTDEATGKVVLGPMEATTVQLFVEPLDGSHGALWVTRDGGTGDQRKARVVTATVGQPVRLGRIEVGPAGSISGTVRDRSTGEPVANVCAYPYAFDPRLGGLFGPRCSNSAGRYTISGLGPYAWPVLYTSAPIYGRAWQWSGNVADRFSARMVPVTPGGTATQDARVVPGGTVSGSVVDRSGTPVFATVNAYNARTGDFAASSTSSEPSPGSPFVVKGLATQQVKIQYEAAGSCWYLDKSSFDLATRLSVTAGTDVGPLTLVDCGS